MTKFGQIFVLFKIKCFSQDVLACYSRANTSLTLFSAPQIHKILAFTNIVCFFIMKIYPLNSMQQLIIYSITKKMR